MSLFSNHLRRSLQRTLAALPWLSLLSPSRSQETPPLLTRVPEKAALPLSPRIPIGHSSDPVTLALLQAAASGIPLSFYYDGGSTPGALRRILPIQIFRTHPHSPTYVRGHCHRREEIRTFRIDRIRLA